MDMSSALWLSELEMDDPIVSHQQSLQNDFDHQLMAAAAFNSSLSSESYSAAAAAAAAANYDDHQSMISNQKYTPVDDSSYRSEMDVITKPAAAKMTKTNNFNSSISRKQRNSTSSSAIISFEKESSTPIHWDDTRLTYLMKPEAAKKEIIDIEEGGLSYLYNNNNDDNRASPPVKRSPLQAQDHVLAERKRRERLTQRFISLSALLPGLKKMDKASVLEDATKYIKHLQERVRTLEEKTARCDTMKHKAGVASVKRSRMYLDEESSSSNEDPDCCPGDSFPDIEVRISEDNVMFRVQSSNIPGLAVKVLSKIEKLHLTITSSSVIPFSNSCLLITIISQMEAEFCMSANDLAKTLQLATLELMSN